MTPYQLGALAREHRYANDPKARRPEQHTGDAAWLLLLAARANASRGR